MRFARVWRVSTAVAVGATLGRASISAAIGPESSIARRSAPAIADWKKAVVLSKERARRRSASPTARLAHCRAWLRRCRCAVEAGSPSTSFARAWSSSSSRLGTSSYALRSIPEVGGGFLAEEVRTGRVLAMQGGFDVVGSSYNRATQAMRQPGSAFKPIVYEAALENGMTPASIIMDAPFCTSQGAGLPQKCFLNFDRRYAGPKTMRWGVEQSRNLMTVRAASQTGMAKVTANAKKLGVGDYPQLSLDFARRRRNHRCPDGQRLCDPREPGPRGEADD